jgi:DNA-binding LytR/AlgR family response regulator
MRKITCMIVEDEPVSQEILKAYIDDYPSLELLAICNNAVEASARISSLSPMLLFLDITMPKISGIDFYKSLTEPPPVIFTTAYPEYAVVGFEVNALDYLVKPFAFERFLKAMNKVQELFSNGSKVSNEFVTLQADKKIHNVNVNDILYLEAMGDYVKVFLPGKHLIVHQTLQRLYDQFSKENFYRVHKSFAIALKKLEYIEGNTIWIQGHQIPIGQTYRNDFFSMFQKR